VHNNPPYPSFEGTFILKRMYLGKHFNKSFLEHILRILPIMCKPVTYRQHLGAVSVIQLPLCSSITMQASSNNGLFCHVGLNKYPKYRTLNCSFCCLKEYSLDKILFAITMQLLYLQQRINLS